MGFTQGISGLNAAASDLAAIGNNIANSKTVGYKAGRVEFADIFSGAQGLGVQVADISRDFTGGSLNRTGRDLDLAIDGEGFFRLAEAGQVMYSRNGQFHKTKDGFIANAQGAQLTGYNVSNFNSTTAEPIIATSGTPQAIHIPTAGLNAKATTEASMVADLDAGAAIITPAVPFDPNDSDNYNWTAMTTVFDSLGNAHNVSLHFTKTAVNTWEVRAHTIRDDGSSWYLASDSATPAPTTLSFDSSGNLTGVNTAGNFNAAYALTTLNGSNPINFTFNFRGATQTAQDFRASNPLQNGYTSGDLVDISIQGNGMIRGTYTNGQSINLAQVALASFASNQGLQPVGDNAWVETAASGQPVVGVAGSGQFGELLGSTLEGANVDLSEQLVQMIIAQRTYQANAQTIKTQSQILQTAVNLAR